MSICYRVLSLDGGGIRGIYTAAYLDGLVQAFAKRRKVGYLDLGKGFNLIVGTSTGAIIGCALAKGVHLEKVVNLYRCQGSRIFEQPIYDGWRVIFNFFGRGARLKRGASALTSVLEEALENETIGEVFARRGISLAIPTVELSRYQSLVLKSSHAGGHRDDDVRLVDACLASSAAPIFRSLASFEHGAGAKTKRTFADGGLWANNPALAAMLDGLRATEVDDSLHVFAMGTCPRPEGEQVSDDDLNRGLFRWKFGARVAQLSIAAQEVAYDHMTRLFANEFRRLDRSIEFHRFPSGQIAQSTMPYLSLDNASKSAMDALLLQAQADVDHTLSQCDDPGSETGRAIRTLFEGLPVFEGDIP